MDTVSYLYSVMDRHSCLEWHHQSCSSFYKSLIKSLVTICSFSCASAWVEKFKAECKKTIQKSKFVRKQLMPMPYVNIPSYRLETSITPYRPKAHHNLFSKDTILCGITCPIIKSLFHEHTLKYAEAVEDCTVTSNLRGK